MSSASWGRRRRLQRVGKSALGGSAASSVRGNATHELGRGGTDAPAQALVVRTDGERVLVRVARAGDAFVHRGLRAAGERRCGRRAGAGRGALAVSARTCSCPTRPAERARLRAQRVVRPSWDLPGDRPAPRARRAAALRFEWLDRVAPARPRLRARTTRGRVRLAWDAAREAGQRNSYTAVIDGERCGGSAPTIRSPPGRQPSGSHEAPSSRCLRDRPGWEPRTTGVRASRIRWRPSGPDVLIEAGTRCPDPTRLERDQPLRLRHCQIDAVRSSVSETSFT